MPQVAFGTDDFASNPDPRCPCVLVLDVSGSMSGRKLDELNAGLAVFQQELQDDALATRRAEIATVTFGPVRVVHDFVSAELYAAPTLSAQGDTPMGAAVIKAMQLVTDRKATLQENGILYFRPWIFLITDGAPTDDTSAAAMAIREGEAAQKFSFFAVGVADADMGALRQLSVREPLKLAGLSFRELFSWLSASMKRQSASAPGTSVAIPSPAGWAEI